MTDFSIVYVLVSQLQEYYIDQMYISIISLKKHNPQLSITLVTDTSTKDIIVTYPKPLLDAISCITIVDIPSEFSKSSMMASRFIKTSLRKYVKGDFLYIDCDTIVYKEIIKNKISRIGHICAVYDAHTTFQENPYRLLCIKQGKLLNWPVEQENEYYNSGIIYVDSSPISDSFYELWHSLWKEGLQHNIRMDQPSFSKANFMMGYVVSPLPPTYNCQLKHGFRGMNEVIILHYLYNKHINKYDQIHLLHNPEFLSEYRASGKNDYKIWQCLESPINGVSENVRLINGANYTDIEDSLVTELVKNYNKPIYQATKYIYKILKVLFR